MTEPTGQPDISVVIPTYNRGSQLRPLLQGLLQQDPRGVRYEIIVVDNNSRDNTAAVIEEARLSDDRRLIQYLFESRQGVSYARNTGIKHARAPIIAFIDDDVVPARDWAYSIKQAMDQYPEADCIGGRVRAVWSRPRPSWLDAAHEGPLALQDWPEPRWVNRESASNCLVTANLACRRELFDEVGLFSPDYPRNQDRELEMRFWHAGKQGLYLPAMDVFVEIPEERLTKRYHRRWRVATGSYHAKLRFRDLVDGQGRLHDQEEKSRRLFGAPLFMYRECLGHLIGWCKTLVSRNADRRFYHESRLWYCASFLWTRFKTDVLSRFRLPSTNRAVPHLP
jgi:glucosyl-dolichyl phosphate glucuronosyltransferase